MLKNAFRKVKNKLGFTMVEVLVVVGIIAITTLTRMQTALRRKLKSPEFHALFH